MLGFVSTRQTTDAQTAACARLLAAVIAQAIKDACKPMTADEKRKERNLDSGRGRRFSSCLAPTLCFHCTPSLISRLQQKRSRFALLNKAEHGCLHGKPWIQRHGPPILKGACAGAGFHAARTARMSGARDQSNRANQCRDASRFDAGVKARFKREEDDGTMHCCDARKPRIFRQGGLWFYVRSKAKPWMGVLARRRTVSKFGGSLKQRYRRPGRLTFELSRRHRLHS